MPTEKMCRKIKYATDADAMEFAKDWASRNPNAALQYPYRCEDCISCYHLTCTPRESFGLSRPRQMMNPTKTGHSREDVAVRRRKVAQYRDQGKSGSEIGVVMGIPKETVYADFNVLNGRKAKPPVTVESLEQEQAAIDAQSAAIKAKIETLRQKEAAALLAKQFRFFPRTDGRILIRKDDQQMHLCTDDAFELVDRLTEYLTALPSSAS
jgi:hypothetical protein